MSSWQVTLLQNVQLFVFSFWLFNLGTFAFLFCSTSTVGRWVPFPSTNVGSHRSTRRKSSACIFNVWISMIMHWVFQSRRDNCIWIRNLSWWPSSQLSRRGKLCHLSHWLDKRKWNKWVCLARKNMHWWQRKWKATYLEDLTLHVVTEAGSNSEKDITCDSQFMMDNIVPLDATSKTSDAPKVPAIAHTPSLESTGSTAKPQDWPPEAFLNAFQAMRPMLIVTGLQERISVFPIRSCYL